MYKELYNFYGVNMTFTVSNPVSTINKKSTPYLPWNDEAHEKTQRFQDFWDTLADLDLHHCNKFGGHLFFSGLGSGIGMSGTSFSIHQDPNPPANIVFNTDRGDLNFSIFDNCIEFNNIGGKKPNWLKRKILKWLLDADFK